MVNHLNQNDNLLAGLTLPTRNHFFYGKLMDACHFALETDYQNRKRWLLNRLNLGAGVVCGLTVVPTNDRQHLQVGAGLAIDCLGREIIVSTPSPPIDPRQPTDDWGRPMGDRISGEGTVFLYLAYHECEAELVPVLVGDCGKEPTCAPNLIRERYRILVKQESTPADPPSCQLPNIFTAGTTSATLHDRLVDRISQPCSDMTGNSGIVLAKVNLPATGTDITLATIDLKVRPLVYSQDLLLELLLCLSEQGRQPPTLTTVTQTSWTLNGEMSLNDFQQNGLTITFSDSITPITITKRAWFIVTVEYSVDTTEFQAAIPFGTVLIQRVQEREINITGPQVLFLPDINFGNTFTNTIESASPTDNPLCRVVIKGDFLRDSQNLKVDGNADGIPGGDFESCFFINRQVN